MATKKSDVEKLVEAAPDSFKKVREASQPIKLEEVFPGDRNKSIRTSLLSKGTALVASSDGSEMEIGAILNNDGYVMGLAAKVSRKPDRSFDYVKNITDFTDDTGNPRQDRIPVYYNIYHQEGVINNAINKTAALVSAEGNFYVRRARSGNRKISNVEEELVVILDYWKRHVNSRGKDGPVTGAKGLPSVLDQATRQALVEGSWIGYIHEQTVNIPTLGKTVKLPMLLQSMSSRYIEIPQALVGTGLEQFFWKPPREVINALTGRASGVRSQLRKEAIEDAVQNSIDPEVISSLKEHGEVRLDPSRIVHIKHRGVDTQPFGQSFIQPVISDLSYKRSLQALDFVTVEAMINRLLIVKVGSDDPASDYHNLEFAQKRLSLLRQMFDTVDPNMTILWAGPDIEVVDVGVHNQLAELDGRYETINERILLSMGVPRALLTGESANGQIWAGYEGYRETLRSMQNDFAQALMSIGLRIAEMNAFEGVDLEFVFDRAVLADQTANADLALRTHRAGLSSLRRTVSAVGGDFESERRNRILERGLDPEGSDLPPDEELFAPPLGMPGDTRVDQDGNVRDPGRDQSEGRPPDSQREDLAPEREPEDRNPRDGQ